MLKHMTILFSLLLSFFLAPPKWIRDLSSNAASTYGKKTRKENARSQKSEYSTNLKTKHMRSILRLWDTDPIHNSAANFAQFRTKHISWFGGISMLIVALLVGSITSRSYQASDSYTWYCLYILASFYVWSGLGPRAKEELILRFFNMQVLFLHTFPFRYTSRLWGRMCEVKLSPWLRPYVYQLFIRTYNVKIEEAVHPDLKHYPSLSDFFRRPIQPSLRSISEEAQVVSPADGRVTYIGCVTDGVIHQVKGVHYSLREFLGPLSGQDADIPDSSYARHLMKTPDTNDLHCVVVYLAPGDYHRFHSPADWRMEQRRHFSGELLSVSPRMLSWIPGLFVLNERVVLSGQWRHGFFSMTAVGATNVGSIVVYGDDMLRTNVPGAMSGRYCDYAFQNGGLSYSRGDSVGEFKLGSTMVIIYEAPKMSQFLTTVGSVVQYGQTVQ